MEEIYVSEVMRKNVTTCSPDTKTKDVIKILSQNRISCLIITKNDEPVGIITERDLVAIMDDMLNDVVCDNLSIDRFMTSPTFTVRSEIILREAVKFAIDKRVWHCDLKGAGCRPAAFGLAPKDPPAPDRTVGRTQARSAHR